jgi:uncharacterized protein
LFLTRSSATLVLERGEIMIKTRISLLDSLRGLGVLGILLCNAPDFAVVPGLAESVRHWPHGADPDTVAVWVATQWLFQRKFVTLFAMLFGVSIFLVGGERSDRERGAILRKRLSWMILFGVLHGFAIWFGDVLLSYALAGFAVALARSWAPSKLLKVGIGIWLGLVLLMAAGMAVLLLQPEDANAETIKAAAEAVKQKAAAAQYAGTFLQSLAQNAKDRLGYLAAEPVIFPMTASLMMIGLGCFKLGVLTGEAPRRVYTILIAAGLFALAVVGVCLIAFATHGLPKALGNFTSWLQMATAPLTTLAYVSLMVLAARSTGVWKAIPNALAPVGQMAFSNYIAQSLIMTAIFYGGRGLSLHGQVDRPVLALIVLGVWIAQILWSRWWMDRFTMGPLEWLWRRLYRGPMALRRAPAEPAVAG